MWFFPVSVSASRCGFHVKRPVRSEAAFEWLFNPCSSVILDLSSEVSQLMLLVFMGFSDETDL